MPSIAVTADEVAAKRLTPEHEQAAVDAIRTEGYVIVEDVISLDHLDALHDRLIADIPAYQARADKPFNWHPGNIQFEPPRDPHVLFADVLMNDLAIQVTHRMLGDGITNMMYGGNMAMPSDRRQPVHADVPSLWPIDQLEVQHPPAELVVNLYTVDVSAENGSTEIWPGSHLVLFEGEGEGDIEVPTSLLEQRRAEVPPIQPTVRRGSLLIRDIRLWHAGMPNRTQAPRPMVAMIHTIGWYANSTPLRFLKQSEQFLTHPVLRQGAEYVDGPIDHIAAPGGHGLGMDESMGAARAVEAAASV